MDIYSGLDPILPKGSIEGDMKGQEPGRERAPKTQPQVEENLEGIKAMDPEQIGGLLKEFGIQDSPENRALILLALLGDIPTKGDTLPFFIGKRFKTSHFYKTIISKALEEGYNREVMALKEILPEPKTLVAFLKDLDKNLALVRLRTLGLCDKILQGEDKSGFKRQLGDIYSGILLQMDGSLPFLMAQVPLLVEDDIYPSEIWVDRERETAYIEVTLPYLRTAGCLLEDWSRELRLTIFIKPEFKKVLQDRIPELKSSIEDLGMKCGAINLKDIDKDSGVLSFLSRFCGERKTIDIRV